MMVAVFLTSAARCGAVADQQDATGFKPMPEPTADTPRSERSLQLEAELARVALGDRAAFGALYRATSGRLLALIQRITVDRGLAEDVLQEVYVNVWRAAGSYEAQRSQPMTWLIALARHRAIDALRRRKGDAEHLSLGPAVDGDDGVDGADDEVSSVADPAAGPLELLQQAGEARGVAHCLEQLSREQRQCLALTYYQGLSHAETAQHLAQPLGSVKSWVRRGLQAIKDCLDRAGLAHGR